ncbi:MAG TPA: ATP-binding protein [Ignavibacteria bacterium]
MYLTELNNLIEEGENSHIEFKRKFSTSEKIAKEMVAFANTKGGHILFGIDDDRKIIGVESEKEELELINTAAEFYCEPEIEYSTEILFIKNKDVVVVTIFESKKKPVMLITDSDSESKVYIRYNDQSILASKETIGILKNSNPDSKPLQITLGDTERILLKYLTENKKITVKGFKKLANISERRASRTLINLVRAEVVRHHRQDNNEFFTLV